MVAPRGPAGPSQLDSLDVTAETVGYGDPVVVRTHQMLGTVLEEAPPIQDVD